MGSSPSAPVAVIPKTVAPTTYISVNPLESYQQAADYFRRTEEELGKVQGERYRDIGTPAEMGARAAGRRTQEAASYLAALPTGDKYLTETTGQEAKFAPAKEIAQAQLTDAQQAYGKAVSRIDEVPKTTITPTPSWATSTIPEAMPGYQRPKTAEEITAEKEEALKQAKLDTQIAQQKRLAEAKPNTRVQARFPYQGSGRIIG